MKKFKIYSSISLISGLLIVLVSVLVPIIKLSNRTAQHGSIGIIGGADGPTAIYLTSHLLGERLLFIFVLGLTLFLCGGFCLVFKRTVTNNCRLKTTALSLIISFFGASGLSCFFIWYSIVTFLEMSMHPIAYPLSIIGGILSLVTFIIAIILYIKARKEHFKIKGIVVDIITSIITLPTFFLVCTEIYNLLQQII